MAKLVPIPLKTDHKSRAEQIWSELEKQQFRRAYVVDGIAPAQLESFRSTWRRLVLARGKTPGSATQEGDFMVWAV